jgi:hypothetical protein
MVELVPNNKDVILANHARITFHLIREFAGLKENDFKMIWPMQGNILAAIQY